MTRRELMRDRISPASHRLLDVSTRVPDPGPLALFRLAVIAVPLGLGVAAIPSDLRSRLPVRVIVPRSRPPLIHLDGDSASRMVYSDTQGKNADGRDREVRPKRRPEVYYHCLSAIPRCSCSLRLPIVPKLKRQPRVRWSEPMAD
jgi:hypothetical protein